MPAIIVTSLAHGVTGPFQAQAPDDLSVRRGDWVYADLSNQTIDGWLWCYAPKLRKYGFIPKAYARPPAMTSL